MLQPFIAANKAVFGAMYTGSTSAFCPSSIASGYSFILKNLQLDAWIEFCRPANFVATTQQATTLLPTASQQSTTTNTITPTTTTHRRRNNTTLIAVVVVVAVVGIVLLAAIIALVVYKRKRGPTVNNFRSSRQLCTVDASELYYAGSNGVTPLGSAAALVSPPAPAVDA